MKVIRKIISVTELGEVLGISRSLAYQLVNNGDVRSIRLGKRIVIPNTEVDRILQNTKETI